MSELAQYTYCKENHYFTAGTVWVKYEDVKELQAENKALNNTISVIIEAVTSKDWEKACAIIEVMKQEKH